MTSDLFSQPVQNNYGSGVFIGRDNIRLEMVDAKTKALLAKMTEQAPTLGRLIETALRDGVISPEIAASLSMAARAINEDVALALEAASHSINWDVASLLTDASKDINRSVANEISSAATSLGQFDVAGLQRLADELRTSLGEVSDAVVSLRNETGRIEGVGASAPSRLAESTQRSAVGLKVMFYTFLFGVAAGAIGWAALLHHFVRR